MGLTEFTDVMLPAVEAELNKQISRLDEPTHPTPARNAFIPYGLVRGRFWCRGPRKTHPPAFTVAYLCILRCRLEDWPPCPRPRWNLYIIFRWSTMTSRITRASVVDVIPFGLNGECRRASTPGMPCSSYQTKPSWISNSTCHRRQL